jgi:predicted nucleic acid-binding protein
VTKALLLFDASSIMTLLRDLRGDASDKLLDGRTISLAYYEVGNALWRECFLLKRISLKEAENLLKVMYEFIEEMKPTSPENSSEGNLILDSACKFNLTFYDSAYLAEAQRSQCTLVTDDKKLTVMAQKAGVKTLTSKDLTS